MHNLQVNEERPIFEIKDILSPVLQFRLGSQGESLPKCIAELLRDWAGIRTRLIIFVRSPAAAAPAAERYENVRFCRQ